MPNSLLLRFTSSIAQSLDPKLFSLKGSATERRVFTSLCTKRMVPPLNERLSLGVMGIPFFNFHLERLLQNAEAFEILNKGLEQHQQAWIEDAITKAISAHIFEDTQPNCDFRIRIVLDNAGLELQLEPYSAPWPDGDSIVVKSIPTERRHPSIKSTLIGESSFARDSAEKAGCQEAFLVDSDGYLREGAWSNIFWFEADGSLKTPRTKLLPGVTRRVVIDNANCIECDILMSDFLQRAQEVCISQSSTGITPVLRVDSTTVGSGQPGPRVKQLKELYERLSRTHFTPLIQRP